MIDKSIYLHDIACVVPEYAYTQEQVLDFLLRLHGSDEKLSRFITRLSQNSSIRNRYSVLPDYGRPPEEYEFFPRNRQFSPEPGTEIRNDIFIRESGRLALEAAEALMDRLPNFDRHGISHVVTASCTGFGAPGFDLHLVKGLGLPPEVDRYHLGFMGCLAAFPALKLAWEICRAEPEARVLVVNVELCTLHFQSASDPDTLVANSLFADGVSAALVSAAAGDSPAPRIRLDRFVSRYIENTESDMAWKVGDTGFLMKLSRYVPQYIDTNLSPILRTLISRAEMSREDIRVWAIHPGGRAILEKAAKSLELGTEDLSESYGILRDYGNMSSATIMFVLERILRSGKRGPLFSAAFGPGLTVEAGIGEVTA